MKARKKKQDVACWLRIGTLTLSTLGLLVNAIATRVRKQKSLARMLAEQQARLSSMSSGLLERAGQFSQSVAEQSTKMTYDFARRGDDLAYELGNRGEKLAHGLKKRGGSTWMHSLGERGECLAQQLKKRTRKAQRKNNAILVALGFGFGLIITSLVTIFFTLRRLQQQLEEDTHVQLEREMVAGTTEPPVDATLVGVVSTKHYYPIETPLEQLETDDQVVIYFSSEDRAKELGFTPALV